MLQNETDGTKTWAKPTDKACSTKCGGTDSSKEANNNAIGVKCTKGSCLYNTSSYDWDESKFIKENKYNEYGGG